MKANQTKVKKERPYGQSFQERSVALAVLCAGCGADLYFQLHSHVRYSAGLPEVQCESRYPGKPVGRSLLETVRKSLLFLLDSDWLFLLILGWLFQAGL